ncbi:mitochondrial carrier [Marasmius fiardii PR-910]|nr:mitochondrial carrier [Marasmius fiardii PR-910]
MEDLQQSKQPLNPTIDFIAGTMGGVAGLVVGFPFDTVKVRLQSASLAHRNRLSSMSPSTIQLMLSIAREDKRLGIWGLFRGISSPIATAAPLNGLVFASYKFLLNLQMPPEELEKRKFGSEDEWTPTLTQIALAGMGCGVISSMITTPTELIKIRQQTSSPSSSSSSQRLPTAREVALDIYRRNGIQGLYRGITATALRDLGYGSYFFAYEATCRYLPPLSSRLSSLSYHSETGALVHDLDHRPESSWTTLLVAGGVAGIAGWILTFPMDVVKTRVQGSDGGYYTSAQSAASSSSASAAPPYTSSSYTSRMPVFAHNRALGTYATPSTIVNPYRTTMSTIVNSYKAEGWGVFWKGLGPTLLRAVPVNMATFAVFEGVAYTLS